MPFDYIGAFPIPVAILPKKLRDLLGPVSFDPQQRVEVASLFESDPHGPNVEHLHFQTAVIVGHLD